jgi:hypothetical protein
LAIALTAMSALPAGAARAWTVVPDATTPATTELTGVACVSSTHCFAVGYRQTADDDKAVIEQGYGKSWTKMTRPDPAGRQPSTVPPLSSLVCASPGNCFAVGTYFNANDQATALIYHWNGKAWGLMKGAAPVIVQAPHVQRSPQTSLNSVACPTPKSCFAVGYYEGLNGTINTLVEHWAGTTWASQAAPTTNALSTVLQSVACVTNTNCFAVGTSMSAAHNKPFIIRWNGKTWATVVSPGLASASLDDVACASAKACFALGSVPSSATSTLLERWNGTKWSKVTLKNMPTANHLFGITCPSTTTCIAVGRRAWTQAGFRPLAVRWNGTTWTAESPPTQPGATSNWLNALTCSSTTVCRAVGTYLAGDSYHSFIENDA